MNESILALLLVLIKNNESMNILLKKGLEYSQISIYINYSIENEYIKIGDDRLIVTEKGLEKIKNVNSEKTTKWIRPLYERRIDKLGKFDIYVPTKFKK